MPKSLTANPTFAASIPSVIPITGEVNSETLFTNWAQDTYDRLFYLKDQNTNHVNRFDNGAIKLGFTFDDATLPNFTGTLINANKDIYNALIDALNFTQNDINSLNTINGRIGGDLLNNSPAYATTNIATNGDSHHTVLEKFDVQVSANATAIGSLGTTTTQNEQDIDFLADRISSDPLNVTPNAFGTASPILVDDTFMLTAIGINATTAYANRRLELEMYELITQNWRDANSLAGSSYTFDTFFNNLKVDTGNSTASGYNLADRSFGRSDITWTMYSNNIVVPGTTNEVKFKYFGEGTIAVTATLSGDLTTGYVSISSEDSWISIPVGTALKIKITGNAGSKIYSYACLFRTN